MFKKTSMRNIVYMDLVICINFIWQLLPGVSVIGNESYSQADINARTLLSR